MMNYHLARSALIDSCNRRLSAPVSEDDDDDMDAAGGPEDVEW